MTCRIYMNGKLIEWPILPGDTIDRLNRQVHLNKMSRRGFEFDSLLTWIPFHFGQYIASLEKNVISSLNYDTMNVNFNNYGLVHCYGRWWMLDMGSVVYRVYDGSNPPRKPPSHGA
ncbi:MAG: hypothetical protein EOP83_32595 [Verrucomicrobiaceae bacterium]|nr:MAG: hypothetical protein EOP83_32595 [Verrucomicrobiaceae bacterium]